MIVSGSLAYIDVQLIFLKLFINNLLSCCLVLDLAVLLTVLVLF